MFKKDEHVFFTIKTQAQGCQIITRYFLFFFVFYNNYFVSLLKHYPEGARAC